MALLLGTACQPTPEPPPPEGIDVVVVAIDACRPDRSGAYGYPLDTTPELDAIAALPESVVFERAYVAGNWTKPATASLFTSRHVHQHGVTNLHREVEGNVFVAERLEDRFDTLAEFFDQRGYETFGLVTSLHLSPQYGFAQGFDTYFDPDQLKVGDVGRIDKLGELMGSATGNVFAYLHQNACHYPFRKIDMDLDFLAEIGGSREGPIDFATSEVRDEIIDGTLSLSIEERDRLWKLYDATFHRADRESIGDLRRALESLGRWDRTLLIVTSDHGEELYEHGGYAHGFAAWEEVIRVPLVVKYPVGMRPEEMPDRVQIPVSNVDLFPSLMSFVGAEPDPGMVGRDVLTTPPREVVPVLMQGFNRDLGPHTALILGGDKLVLDTRLGDKFFDLLEDPGELSNLFQSEPERVARLRQIMAELMVGEYEAEDVVTELSEEQQQTLRSLGYLN